MTRVRVRVLGSERGVAFMSVLVAMLIAAALYFGYFQFQRPEGARSGSGSVTALDATREFACRNNRQTIERDMTMWLVSHPDEVPSLEQLEEDQGTLATCPEGGSYRLAGRTVLCSIHP